MITIEGFYTPLSLASHLSILYTDSTEGFFLSSLISHVAFGSAFVQADSLLWGLGPEMVSRPQQYWYLGTQQLGSSGLSKRGVVERVSMIHCV